MTQYGNLAGNSGVVAFDINGAFIDVEFRRGGVYRYTSADIGGEKLAQMVQLAKTGKGLATFIARDRAVNAAGFNI